MAFTDVAGIERVIIYGSWAARHSGQAGPPPTDIDVLVVGHPDRDDVYEAARRATDRLGVEVNTTIRTPRQWDKSTDAFARQIKSAPLFPVIDRSAAGYQP